MRRRIGATVTVAAWLTVGMAHAATTDVIETSTTGPIGVIGLPVAQSFRPAMSGRVTSVAVWPASSQAGRGLVTS